VADGMWVTACADSAWVTVWVASCGLRCVGDDVGDDMWVKVR